MAAIKIGPEDHQAKKCQKNGSSVEQALVTGTHLREEIFTSLESGWKTLPFKVTFEKTLVTWVTLPYSIVLVLKLIY